MQNPLYLTLSGFSVNLLVATENPGTLAVARAYFSDGRSLLLAM